MGFNWATVKQFQDYINTSRYPFPSGTTTEQAIQKMDTEALNAPNL